ncbi:RDD family protein [Kaistella flava (ex Peng et al. 2021)]|uniref:RDD family protein n=1 Tax=Kaistella flava (ex Peng et al. 2021) TaxID=2038776 RepID=UPI0018806B1F|nr:RDD family protein [Kaistella flava (ex Peng et al. 2021)]
MKISELKESKTIRRPTKAFDKSGNRIYEELQYDFPFREIQNLFGSERLFSKIIDILPLFLILHVFFHFELLHSFLYAIPAVIISGTILETIFGSTLGKKIFDLKVIDDFGRFPNFSKSLKRNLLCLINLFPSFYDFQSKSSGVWLTGVNFNMQLNNKFCKTYVVKSKVAEKIKEMLNSERFFTI